MQSMFRGPEGEEGEPGVDGIDGWSTILAAVADTDRRVFRVVDWVGGEAAKPATGNYVGSTGLVDAAWTCAALRAPMW